MAHLTNFSFELFYKIFTEDASQPLLYHGAKKSKMTKNSNQGGGGSCLKHCEQRVSHTGWSKDALVKRLSDVTKATDDNEAIFCV